MANQSGSANLKLYILLAVTAGVFVIFAGAYLKDYFNYYRSLYNYRNALIASLTQDEIIKPVYNETDPYIGSKKAKITIFEYADFSCGACKALQPELQKLVDFYGKEKIMLIWKDLPVTGAAFNMEAHQAARCAGDQGKFFEYAGKLYENQDQFSIDTFTGLATQLSLDVPEFKLCLNSKKYQDLVEHNFRESLQNNLVSAPTLFINNRLVQSGYTFENLRNIVEQTK